MNESKEAQENWVVNLAPKPAAIGEQSLVTHVLVAPLINHQSIQKRSCYGLKLKEPLRRMGGKFGVEEVLLPEILGLFTIQDLQSYNHLWKMVVTHLLRCHLFVPRLWNLCVSVASKSTAYTNNNPVSQHEQQPGVWRQGTLPFEDVEIAFTENLPT